MNPNGSNIQRLTNTPGNELFPDMSPDMQKIAYALVDFQTFNAEIHTMNADGAGDSLLAKEGNISENAQWSPDGKKIIFQTDRTGNFYIFVMNADGYNPENITESPAFDYWPSWGRIQMPTNVKYITGKLSRDLKLHQNYPNPFNSTTKIKFDLPNNSRVQISVYNLLGNKISDLVNKKFNKGYHEIDFNAKNLPSGLYLYYMNARNFNEIKKCC